ncbi:hypothetical protein NAEGRDRAFT_58774 [Naegleria gruberi]|uniref:Uncharacterized protein n=1 Tax=Naegleria gruberi TaxID=5762 RepID=D2VNR4_NAEGR|nr:uncharacterized protein NAEGRDRAFT_58774 [Naegleria gruberi]EFC41458.1 hypothetical protein NAEGRDRAFT_58774 [Naegleria gruberi]|eukprot:XP_002674202.1 hypothetical protein NAEGRDRAFT_58774 [Naegleria gruberi strain NEG-M]
MASNSSLKIEEFSSSENNNSSTSSCGVTTTTSAAFNDLPDSVLGNIMSFVFSSFKYQLNKPLISSSFHRTSNNNSEEQNHHHHNGEVNDSSLSSSIEQDCSPEELYHRSIYELETLPSVSQSPLHKYLHKNVKFHRSNNGANREFDEADDEDFDEDTNFGLIGSGDINYEQKMIGNFCEFLQNWISFASVNSKLRKFMKRSKSVGDLIEFDLINFAYFYMFNNEKLVSPTYSCVVEGQDVFVRNEYRTVVHQLFMDFIRVFVDREFVKRICLDCSYLFDWVPINGDSLIDDGDCKTFTIDPSPSTTPNYLEDYNKMFPNVNVLTINFTYRGKTEGYEENELSLDDLQSHLLTLDTSNFQTLSHWKHLNELRLCWHVDVDEDTQVLDLVLGSHLMQEFLNIVSEAKKINHLLYISVYINGSAFHVTRTESGQIICNDSYPTRVMEELSNVVDENSMLKLLYICIDHYGYAHYKKQPLQLSLMENILHIEINDITCPTINQLFNLSYPKLLTLILTDICAPSKEERDVAITSKFPKLEELLIKSKLNSTSRYTKFNLDLSHMKAEKIKKVCLYGVNDFLISKNSFGNVIETLEILVLKDNTFNYSHWFTSLSSLKNLRFKVEPTKKRVDETDYDDESVMLCTTRMKSCTTIVHDKLTNLHIKDRNTKGISVICPRLKELVVKAPNIESCEILCPTVKTIDLNDILMGFEQPHNHSGNFMKFIKYSSHQWKWHTPLLNQLNLMHSLRPNYTTNDNGGTNALILPNALISHVKELQVKLSVTTFDNEKELFPPLFARIDNLCGHKNLHGTLEKVKIKLDIATYYLSEPMLKHFRAVLEWNGNGNNAYDSDSMKLTIQQIIQVAKCVDHFTDHTMILDSPYLASLDVHLDEKVERTKISCPNLKRFELIDCNLPGRVKFSDETASSLEHICLVGICSPFNPPPHSFFQESENLRVGRSTPKIFCSIRAIASIGSFGYQKRIRPNST